MKTAGEIRQAASSLWHDGWRGDKQARPLSVDKPLIPSAIAKHLDCSMRDAISINHCLVVWSVGSVPVGEFEAL